MAIRQNKSGINIYMSGLDRAIKNIENKYGNLGEAMVKGGLEAGEYLQSCIVDKFGFYQEGWVTLAEDTIRKKGNDEPLIDKSDMMFSFETKVAISRKEHCVVRITSNDEKLIHHIYGAPDANVPMRDPVRPTIKEERDECIRIMQEAIKDVIE